MNCPASYNWQSIQVQQSQRFGYSTFASAYLLVVPGFNSLNGLKLALCRLKMKE